ncbi:MAG: hypothetical protein MJ211_03245 [Bacteroidales bacterium]|nr:hypothetical protein [Bacteroidales bacterium]
MKTLIKLLILSIFIAFSSCVQSIDKEKVQQILDSLHEDSIAKRSIEIKDSIARLKAEMAANPSDTLLIDWYDY